MAKVNVRKRGKKWEWRFEGASVGGKRKQIGKGGYLTQKAAEEAGALAYAEYLNFGEVIKEESISVADFFNEWIEKDVKPINAYNTVRSYQSQIKNHIVPLIGKYKISAVNPSIIQRYFLDLKIKGYSKKSIQQIHATMNRAFAYAVKPCKYIKSNPMADVTLPKMEDSNTDKNVISVEEWKRILQIYPPNNRYRVPFMIGYHTRMRISEVCGLTWDDIDFEHNIIKVRKQALQRKGIAEWCLSPLKTDASTDKITMGKTLSDYLLNLKKQQEINEKELGEWWTTYHGVEFVDNNGDIIIRMEKSIKGVKNNHPRIYPICINESGSFTNSNDIRSAITNIKNKLGIEFCFHDLRHTHGTILAQEDMNPKAIQQRLRHSSIRTTMDTYVHPTREMQDRAVDSFEAHLRGVDKTWAMA